MLTPPAPYHLRPMQLADLPEVRAIEKVSLPSPTKKGGYEHELTNNSLANYQVLTVNGSTIIGYSGYWLIADEQHITIVAIHPSWRRRGLGELLLLNMFIMAQTENVTLGNLEVRASNIAAQALYQKYTFTVSYERKKYYRDGESALVMTAVLPLPDLEQRTSTLFTRLQSEGLAH